MSVIVPAVLPQSKQDLDEKLSLFSSFAGVERIQIDVVDGRFASPASWPYNAPDTFAQMMKRGEYLPYAEHIAYEVDLMCVDAYVAAESWLSLGARRLTFHAGTTTDPARLLSYVRGRYGDAVHYGLAVGVETDLGLVEQNLQRIDYVQFMGIAMIGRQGQPFDRRVFEKIRVFRERHPDFPVQIDGGITLDVARKVRALGVSEFVVGSAIIKAQNPIAAFTAFEELVSPFGV